jgi:hypothetical protein
MSFPSPVPVSITHGALHILVLITGIVPFCRVMRRFMWDLNYPSLGQKGRMLPMHHRADVSKFVCRRNKVMNTHTHGKIM